MTDPRTYDVVALTVPISYNAHGDRDAHGTVFALGEHLDALRAVTGDRPDPLVRPLVLRACRGDRVVVQFRNDTGHRAGIHPQGVHYDVERADGGVVGCNPDSAAEPGGRRRYVWDCPNEGVFAFGDLADLRGCDDGSQAHGLFGALVVEPAGATWTDPETGAALVDGLSADVHVPGRGSFREFVTFLQDTAPNDGGPPVALCGYRCEPRSRRPPDDRRYSSWTHGDPATPVLRAYTGDRTLIRLVHAGRGDSHVFHLHGHRWRPADGCPAVDTVAIAPQEALTIEPAGGAGSVHGAAGDAMWEFTGTDVWGVLRVFDAAQDGTGRHPDGTPIPALRPLPGHPPPAEPTAGRPGFPAFVAGVHPGPPPRPPRTPSAPDGTGREPSAPERAAFCDDPRPGEAFTRIGPADAPVRRHHLVALQGVLHHHRGERADHRDDAGVLYVPADDVRLAGGVEAYRARLAAGECDAHPVAIRAAAGEVVELSLTNALPDGMDTDVGAHVHLAGHDPLVAGGAAVGWNYASGVAPGTTRTLRWYCDGELGTAVFADPLLAGRGLFGSLVVEPAGARWTDPHDPGREVTSGETAVVTLPDGTSFREQVLAVADGVVLRRHPHGAAPEPHGRGRVAVGYRCEPLDERPGDPADRLSSREHGDPGTPLPRAYPGERVRIRLYQGAGTARHGVVAHGLRWRSRPGDPSSPSGSRWTVGPGQSADLHVDELDGPGDHLWSLAAGDDVWPGAWGLLRVHDRPVPDLPPLPGAFPVPPAPPRGPVRRYRVVVRAAGRDHGRTRSDPSAPVYIVDGADGAGGAEPGALVLRASAGEWVEVTLVNELSGPPSAAPCDQSPPDERIVSDRVSLHAAGLRHDVRESDGTAAGTNPDSTVKPGHSVTYRWFADAPGPVLLSDRADVRTHRRRGLCGVLVVEPPGVTPVHPSGHGSGWVGEQALLRYPDGTTERELVLLLSDGPVPGTAGSGAAAVNHRSAALAPDRPSLADPNPSTPVLACAPGDRLRVHVVAATDRVGDHSFTVHGHDWPRDDRPDAPRVGTTGGLATGAVRSLALTAAGPGDYAYRSGALRRLTEGLWGVIRVRRP